ncbi:DUF3800 domain-containing protein [Agromyces humatus]|uniref:DUF3800 domain-containing protein n=1 Tax=Agromyces humatus TaxID=279573 RepID=A0ABN2KYL0_9MICO|nr:DUF3800 domain-containing protein [Agromyces humatus]
MLFAFIDESYTKDRYYVAAVLVDADDLRALSAAVARSAEYAAGYGVELGTEFHAHSIMSGRDGWEPVQGKPRAAIAIYRDLLRELSGLPVSIYIEGVDVPRLNARYRYPDPPHLVTLRHVLEDLQQAAAMRGDQVIVICDEVTDQEAHSKKFGEYQLIGTPGYRSTTLSRIEQFMFADSRQSPGLQFADAVAYLYRRRDAHTESSARTARAVEDLWAVIRPRARKARRWDP